MLGFIGCGNMGSALLEGIIRKELKEPGEVAVFDQDTSKLENLQQHYGVQVFPGAAALCARVKTVFLAVKPQDMSGLLHEIQQEITAEHLLISVAAGLKLDFFQGILGSERKVVRVMPNAPCLISKGMSVVSPGGAVTPRETQEVVTLLEALGEVLVLEEKYMDVVTALSGSGPAYVFLFIEALADGGGEMGLSRDHALLLAAQTVFGSAAMLLEKKEHPAVLKNMITSPGGTTSAGLLALEEGAARAAISKAVIAATKRGQALGS